VDLFGRINGRKQMQSAAMAGQQMRRLDIYARRERQGYPNYRHGGLRQINE
jgi:hypothetical protein